MSTKEAKLQKMLSKDNSTLAGGKKIEIEEMIHFLKTEQADVVRYFTGIKQDHIKFYYYLIIFKSKSKKFPQKVI